MVSVLKSIWVEEAGRSTKIILMMKWVGTSGLSIKDSLSGTLQSQKGNAYCNVLPFRYRGTSLIRKRPPP